MILKHVAVCAAIALSSVSAIAAGKTAVITLEFPHGAENCGMGEVGVSLADNINSIFWNPAALPAIGKNLSVQYLYSAFYELLLPSFGLRDLWHTDTIHAFFMPNIVKNVDFGISYSINFVNMGEFEFIDSLDRITGKSKGSETVRSYAAGLQFFDIASVGFAIKDLESRIAPGVDSFPRNGIATAQVFDFGIRFGKKFTLAEAVDIHPAVGYALHSFPQDSVTYFHDTSGRSDPLPLKRWYGASIKINLLGMLGFTAAQEREYAVVDQEFVDHHGYKIQITPFFSILNGTMTDSIGLRFEEQTGRVFTFNYQQTLHALIRCTNLFNPALSDKLQAPNRWAAKHHLNPNVFIQYATSSIHSKGENTAREKQKRKELSMGFSIIGDLSSFCKKKPVCADVKAGGSTSAPDKSIPAETSEKDTTGQSFPGENSEQDTSTAKVKLPEDGEFVE